MKETCFEYFRKHGFTHLSTRGELRAVLNVDPIPELQRSVVEAYFQEFKRTIRKPIDKKTLLKQLEKGISLDNLMGDIYTAKDILTVIQELNNSGYNIGYNADIFKLNKTVILAENKLNLDWDGEQVIRFGVVSDTHLCNKFQQLSFLNHLYELFRREGITDVYHAGDISDGYNKRRPNHIYELIPGCIGVDEQKDYIVKHYPKIESIKTHFITGNHDHWHITNGGANIGKMITRERLDLNYLGLDSVVINITPNCTMKLKHPGKGSSYAISYTTQKSMDAIMGGQKPNILIIGHYHKGEYIFYRNIHCIQAGTTCAQTPWMDSQEISAHVCGWIIEIHVNDEGTITRFKSELIPLYKMVEHDY
jgi:predicted phosphodiesterase